MYIKLKDKKNESDSVGIFLFSLLQRTVCVQFQ